ncbi:MAG: GerMN domain-containing protein [Kineosporiaceae bacterium]
MTARSASRSGTRAAPRNSAPVGAILILLGLAALLGLTAPLASCGIPADTAVHTIDPQDVPSVFATSSSPDSQPPGGGKPELYFADATGRLRAVPLRTEHTTTPEMLQEVLSKLTAGPSATQAADGLSTAVPPAHTLEVADVTDGQATLALGGDQLPPTDQTTAIAQIVLSATSVPGITGVLLTLDGRPIEAPLLDGALTTRPLTAEDYQPLLKPTATPG